MNLVNISLTMDALQALWALRKDDNEPASQTIIRLASREGLMATISIIGTPPASPANEKFHYQILGEKRHTRSAVDAYLDILTILSSLEPMLPERLSLIAKGNSRNHIAPSPAEVYPARPDLAKNARKIAPGWYAGINISNRDKMRILRLACGILRLRFGKDVIF